MVFNSIEFLIFLPIVFCSYWFLFNKSLRVQNIFVTAASYYFYGSWDWRFLFLIFISTVVDYIIGVLLNGQEDEKKRKLLLAISMVVNLGILGFFKYYNFFIESFADMVSWFGFKPNYHTLKIILPVGISFYTFQTMSYTLDVYKRKMAPTSDFIAFSAFVSFFPQLVAGPIERAAHLLPQFYKPRKFDYSSSVDGMRQMLWGMFKKVVIADNCAIHVDDIFNNYSHYSGSTQLLGVIFFAYQIYCDFSGYSDIAIGSARLFGFDLMQNFNYPYFARDIAEFWRRWHISLTTWFRDYVYIPLGGSWCSKAKQVRNTFIVFLVSGFWHGANWTFIVWGGLNALFFMPLLLVKRNRQNLDTVATGRLLPNGVELLQMLTTFALVCLGWIFFRADNVSEAVSYISNMCSSSLFASIDYDTKLQGRGTLIMVVLFVVMEWFARNDKFALEKFASNFPRYFRWAFYSFVIFLIFMFAETGGTPFIYFQF